MRAEWSGWFLAAMFVFGIIGGHCVLWMNRRLAHLRLRTRLALMIVAVAVYAAIVTAAFFGIGFAILGRNPAVRMVP